eukprot:TRINITY_DN3369_c0_g1_i2.p1 TRINITY_DN3369_c0_g1~~TRINITY_DN3369_c0_g1_i2.p1  ORF type:complete len:509 (-),score=55.57 TRINITY_DN3369_c0_g1_i2:28-1554(-)
MFFVPKRVSDELIEKVADFRCKGRVPALSWLHPNNGASIIRCSQPRVGVSRARSLEDETMIKEIWRTNPTGSNIHILDSRPRMNAMANQAMGSGYESTTVYKHCEIEFQDIENIHVMRNSLSEVKEACDHLFSKNGKTWFSKLETSGWIYHIRWILKSAVKLVKLINQGSSVLVHCSDGWDRTSQVCALGQIMLDPFYRTFTGFCILIEKEWVSFGHKFHTRLGHNAHVLEEERSPVFLQFLDCVYQIMQQYPNSFEFNNSLLCAIMDEAYSTKFGTFIGDCEYERECYKVRENTHSLWSLLHRKSMIKRYINPFYSLPVDPEYGTPSPSCLIINTDMSNFYFWYQYYLRQHPKYCNKYTEKVELRATEMCEKIYSLTENLELANREIERLNKIMDTMRLSWLRNTYDSSDFVSGKRSMIISSASHDPLHNPLIKSDEDGLEKVMEGGGVIPEPLPTVSENSQKEAESELKKSDNIENNNNNNDTEDENTQDPLISAENEWAFLIKKN